MAKQVDVVELLLKQKLVTAEQIEQARSEVSRTGLSMEKALEKLKFINEEDIVRVHADALGIPSLNLETCQLEAGLIKLIPESIARKYKILPLFKIGDNLNVGMVNPSDIVAIDNVRRLIPDVNIEVILVSDKSMEKTLDTCYGAGTTASKIAKIIGEGKRSRQPGLVESADESPVIKIVDSLIAEAIKNRASDIHIEPEQKALRIRYRVDGLLQEVDLLPKKLQDSVISRVKVLANMDIAETRSAQDGRINIKLENKELDIRVSTFPTIYGENVVLRLLDKTSVLLGLKELGFLEENLAAFAKLIRRPNGIILVTGPTGSGKTTTLYAALTSVSSVEKNIITIEDPVEYELPLIRQTPINPKAGITFANGLRNILRQDPDIIMVGEIRDKETAEIAIQASLTGHLVFSTLHTNDAPSALTRLIDMGVEPFLVSSSLIGILAQRLVRLICPKCKEKYTPDPDVLKDLGLPKEGDYFHGHGCPACKKTGFVGRIGIFEMLIISEDVRQMVEVKRSADEIKKKAISLGMLTLRQDGIVKIQRGLTTPDEVLRVVETE
ncbi:MAG: GspE/PulE family protein [Candidatus Omnitrophica bacterium]|nr:GspE/PulE family protein [Candidatus Omnitrophota bacterium]